VIKSKLRPLQHTPDDALVDSDDLSHFAIHCSQDRISQLSRYAQELLAYLSIAKGVGDCLTESVLDAVLNGYLNLLTAAIDGSTDLVENRVARLSVPKALELDRQDNLRGQEWFASLRWSGAIEVG
jgi:hypothetical protein